MCVVSKRGGREREMRVAGEKREERELRGDEREEKGERLYIIMSRYITSVYK